VPQTNWHDNDAQIHVADVIVTDEIGNKGDKDALIQVLNAGVKVISTAHGYNISELKSRKEVLSLIEEKMFEGILF